MMISLFSASHCGRVDFHAFGHVGERLRARAVPGGNPRALAQGERSGRAAAASHAKDGDMFSGEVHG